MACHLLPGVTNCYLRTIWNREKVVAGYLGNFYSEDLVDALKGLLDL